MRIKFNVEGQEVTLEKQGQVTNITVDDMTLSFDGGTVQILSSPPAKVLDAPTTTTEPSEVNYTVTSATETKNADLVIAQLEFLTLREGLLLSQGGMAEKLGVGRGVVRDLETLVPLTEDSVEKIEKGIRKMYEGDGRTVSLDKKALFNPKSLPKTTQDIIHKKRRVVGNTVRANVIFSNKT